MYPQGEYLCTGGGGRRGKEQSYCKQGALTSAHFISLPQSPSLSLSLLAMVFESFDANPKNLRARAVHSTRLLCLPEPEVSSQQLASVPDKYRSQTGYEA